MFHPDFPTWNGAAPAAQAVTAVKDSASCRASHVRESGPADGEIVKSVPLEITGNHIWNMYIYIDIDIDNIDIYLFIYIITIISNMDII